MQSERTFNIIRAAYHLLFSQLYTCVFTVFSVTEENGSLINITMTFMTTCHERVRTSKYTIRLTACPLYLNYLTA